MKAYIRGLSAALAAASLVACGADGSVSARRDAVLSDARSDGVAGFYFLPPIAPEPGGGTVNDPGLSPVVVIDEAIEIARTYSGDEATEFVNGVLDAIRADLQGDQDKGGNERAD